MREVIDLQDAASWFQGALGDLHAIVAAHKLTQSGAVGGIFANDLFTHERGEATIYVPCAEAIRPTGQTEIGGRSSALGQILYQKVETTSLFAVPISGS